MPTEIMVALIGLAGSGIGTQDTAPYRDNDNAHSHHPFLSQFYQRVFSNN